MPKGYLQIKVRSANEAFPVNESFIEVRNEKGEVIFSELIHKGDSGISKTLEIEAPDREESLSPQPDIPYSTCNVTASNDKFLTARITGVQIFDGITSILPIEMIPNEPGRGRDTVEYDIPKYKVGDRLPTDPSAKPPEGGRILTKVFIPENVTVHLGTPTSAARNVTVKFVDYIKNVASSEIYPTWPRESLKANIYCQISLVLNRIFTEWYPSRGYDFNITNSTAYDQYFVPGRNIFDSISEVVDEIFNVYIRKPNRLEPFYAEYCNGTTVTCPGLSQWGTVSLANDGLGAKSILEFYYGSVNLIEENDIRAIEGSYPGYPLRLGSSGESVRALQRQLNRIAINYPSINVVEEDGVFGSDTERAVRTFQNLFSLTADGIAGKSTWYKVSFIYAAVKKLAELTSEGEKPPYVISEYPGYPLSIGSKGTYVQEIQFYLNKIALYNQYLTPLKADGFFGDDTRTAARNFQSFYGLASDGIIGRITWDKIISVYQSTIEASPIVPPPEYDIKDYPGYLIKQGQSGDNVLYIQRLLNAISQVFQGIKTISADSKFGPATKSSVQNFQRYFGLSADGIVGPATWNKLNLVYVSVLSGCIFSELPSESKKYPGTLIKQGQRNSNVLYIQQRLNIARLALPYIPRVSQDSIFGSGTKNAVVLFQSVFGLMQDGIVGAETWATLNYISFAAQNSCLPIALSEKSESESSSANEPASLCASALLDENDEATKRILRLGHFGEDVYKVKLALCEKTDCSMRLLGEDHLFGAATKKAVIDFQKKMGLEPNGIIDEKTRKAIFNIG